MTPDPPVYRSFNRAVGIIIEQDGTARILIRDGKEGNAYSDEPVTFEAMEEIVEQWLRVSGFKDRALQLVAELPDLAQERGDGIVERPKDE